MRRAAYSGDGYYEEAKNGEPDNLAKPSPNNGKLTDVGVRGRSGSMKRERALLVANLDAFNDELGVPPWLLDSLVTHARASRSEWVSLFDATDVLVVHAPRTAGTSLQAAVFGENALPETRQHVPARALRDHFGADRYWRMFKLATVRNPFVRLVSAYEHLRSVHAGSPEQDLFAAALLGRRLQSFRELVDFLYDLHLRGDTWRELWPTPKDRGGRGARRVCPALLQPQAEFLLDERGEIIVDAVLAQESLEAGARALRSGSADPSGQRRRLPVREPLPELSVGKARRRWRLAEYYTNNEVVRRVASVYARDFEILGYDSQRVPSDEQEVTEQPSQQQRQQRRESKEVNVVAREEDDDDDDNLSSDEDDVVQVTDDNPSDLFAARKPVPSSRTRRPSVKSHSSLEPHGGADSSLRKASSNSVLPPPPSPKTSQRDTHSVRSSSSKHSKHSKRSEQSEPKARPPQPPQPSLRPSLKQDATGSGRRVRIVESERQQKKDIFVDRYAAHYNASGSAPKEFGEEEQEGSLGSGNAKQDMVSSALNLRSMHRAASERREGKPMQRRFSLKNFKEAEGIKKEESCTLM